MKARAAISCFGLLSTLTSVSASAADLEVTVKGVEHERGAIRVLLYDKQGFLDPEQVLLRHEKPPRTGTMHLRLEGLDPGRYALILYHDEDGNGELNRFLGMVPLEAWGLSNNLAVNGPPDFDQAAFNLPDSGTGIEVRLNY